MITSFVATWQHLLDWGQDWWTVTKPRWVGCRYAVPRGVGLPGCQICRVSGALTRSISVRVDKVASLHVLYRSRG